MMLLQLLHALSPLVFPRWLLLFVCLLPVPLCILLYFCGDPFLVIIVSTLLERSNALDARTHDVPKGEDGEDDETRLAFTGQGKAVESSPGAVETGAKVGGVEGPRDDRQGEVSGRVALFSSSTHLGLR